MNRYKPFPLLMLVVCMAIAVGIGCGRKAPPLPPDIPELQPVAGLTHEITGDAVTLRWNTPKGAGGQLEGYVVHRSVTSTQEDECPGCPIRFRKVAELGSGTTTYTEVLKQGYRYIYKVVAYSKYNTYSNDSELIRFTY